MNRMIDEMIDNMIDEIPDEMIDGMINRTSSISNALNAKIVRGSISSTESFKYDLLKY
ncbi:MAG: hypothetical protein AB9879_15400 [Methanothrix sp.]